MSKYKTILFDADGTLFDFDKAETYALENALKEYGVNCTAEVLTEYKNINASLWTLLEQGKTTQPEIRMKRFEMLFERFGLPGDYSGMAGAYVKYLSKGAFFIDGAVDILEYLHGRYPLYLVTNGITEVQESRYALSGLNKYFSNMFVSEALGAAKPHIEYFSKVFDAIGAIDLSEILIIGDSLSSDIAGGINAGIDTCWYNASKADSKGVKPVYEISLLSELKDIL